MSLTLTKLFSEFMVKPVRLLSCINAIQNQASRLNVTKGKAESVRPEASFYTTRLAMPRDYDCIAKFMEETYFKYDPAMVGIGVCENGRVPPSLTSMMCDQLSDGMTIIAANKDNRLIGVAVNAGSCSWEADHMIEYAKHCEAGPVRDVVEFFAHVAKIPCLYDLYEVLKIFECTYLSVHPEYRDLGVATKLVQESWCLARDCAYRLFRIDCTNKFSSMIAENFGWEKVCVIPYCEYVKDGRHVFKTVVEPHTETEIYIDRVRYRTGYYLPYKKRKITTPLESPKKDS